MILRTRITYNQPFETTKSIKSRCNTSKNRYPPQGMSSYNFFMNYSYLELG